MEEGDIKKLKFGCVFVDALLKKLKFKENKKIRKLLKRSRRFAKKEEYVDLGIASIQHIPANGLIKYSINLAFEIRKNRKK